MTVVPLRPVRLADLHWQPHGGYGDFGIERALVELPNGWHVSVLREGGAVSARFMEAVRTSRPAARHVMERLLRPGTWIKGEYEACPLSPDNEMMDREIVSGDAAVIEALIAEVAARSGPEPADRPSDGGEGDEEADPGPEAGA